MKYNNALNKNVISTLKYYICVYIFKKKIKKFTQASTEQSASISACELFL